MRNLYDPLPRLAGVSALAMCCFIADAASAARMPGTLVTRRLDVVVSNEAYEFDLDQDGVNDFRIIDRGDDTTEITGLSPEKNVLVNPVLPFFPATYTLGGVIDVPADGFDALNPMIFAERTGILSGNLLAPFDTVGDTGFIGLTLSGQGETTFLGFAEITRGSTILGLVGYSTAPGPITVLIPEPAAALLLAGTGLGLVGRRRR